MSKLNGLKFLLKAAASSTQRRHLPAWIASREPHYLLEKPSPWITFDAIDFISARLSPGARIFEFGSGGSTLFWLQWKPELTSVEHDPQWYELVRKRIPAGAGADYRLLLPREIAASGSLSDPSDPDAYATEDEKLRRCTFREYAGAIDQFPNDHFDLVLVDGRARPSCIKHSVAKVRKGGMLVLDNSERNYYLARTLPLLSGFTSRRFEGLGPANAWTWETTVFVKNT